MATNAEWSDALQQRSRSPQRNGWHAGRGQLVAFVVAAALVLGLGVAAVASFARPSGSEANLHFGLGPVEQFPPGTVTAFTAFVGSGQRLAPVPMQGDRIAELFPRVGPRSGRVNFYVVRLGSGELLALNAASPHLGYTVEWRPAFDFNGRTGWFRDPPYGSTFDLAGYRVFGPAARSMDRFAVEIRHGSVYVDLASLTQISRVPPAGFEFETSGVYGPLSSRP